MQRKRQSFPKRERAAGASPWRGLLFHLEAAGEESDGFAR